MFCRSFKGELCCQRRRDAISKKSYTSIAMTTMTLVVAGWFVEKWSVEKWSVAEAVRSGWANFKPRSTKRASFCRTDSGRINHSRCSLREHYVSFAERL